MTEPTPAEESVFIVCPMHEAEGDEWPATPATDEGVIVHGHWMDAEAVTEELIESDPDWATYAVFKLVGTVTMKPRWS